MIEDAHIFALSVLSVRWWGWTDRGCLVSIVGAPLLRPDKEKSPVLCYHPPAGPFCSWPKFPATSLNESAQLGYNAQCIMHNERESGEIWFTASSEGPTRSFPPAPIHPYPLHCLCHWRLSKATDQRQRFVSILLFLLLASTCLPQLSTADKHRRIGKLMETAQWAINGNGFALYVLCWQWLPSKRVSAEISRASNAINLKAKKTFSFFYLCFARSIIVTIPSTVTCLPSDCLPFSFLQSGHSLASVATSFKYIHLCTSIEHPHWIYSHWRLVFSPALLISTTHHPPPTTHYSLSPYPNHQPSPPMTNNLAENDEQRAGINNFLLYFKLAFRAEKENFCWLND